MPSLNKVILIGHLGRDPEIKTTQSGRKVANFSLATSEKWTSKETGQRTEKTEWHKIVAWGKIAEIIEKYLHKGDAIYIEGKLQTRSWDDNDGQKRYATEIFMDELKMLGSKGGNNQNQGQYQNQSQPQQSNGNPSSMPPANEDDLPF